MVQLKKISCEDSSKPAVHFTQKIRTNISTLQIREAFVTL